MRKENGAKEVKLIYGFVQLGTKSKVIGHKSRIQRGNWPIEQIDYKCLSSYIFSSLPITLSNLFDAFQLVYIWVYHFSSHIILRIPFFILQFHMDFVKVFLKLVLPSFKKLAAFIFFWCEYSHLYICNGTRGHLHFLHFLLLKNNGFTLHVTSPFPILQSLLGIPT